MNDLESNRKKYRRLVAGEFASINEWLLQEILVTFVSGIKGALGFVLRSRLYPLVFRNFDRTSVSGCNVTLRCPKQIRLQAKVIVDDYAQLIGNSSRLISIDIGENTFIRSFAMLNSGPPDGFIKVGSNSGIGQSTIIYGNGGVNIGSHVMVAGQCFIIASSHRYGLSNIPIKDQGCTAKGITIGDNVWIGAGCKILDGVTVGNDAVIAANAVVNKNVESGTIVGGVPAEVIGRVDSSA